MVVVATTTSTPLLPSPCATCFTKKQNGERRPQRPNTRCRLFSTSPFSGCSEWYSGARVGACVNVTHSLENSGVERLAVAVMYEMVHSLGRFDRRAAKWRNRIAQEQASGAERILGYTSWAAFTSTMGATFAMRKAPAMEPPSRDKPPLCKGELGECWLPYPGDHPPIFAHSDCHLHYLGTLFETCYSISQCLFGEDKTKADQVTRDDVEELHRELTSWHIDLLGCVQINGVKSPHTLSLQ